MKYVLNQNTKMYCIIPDYMKHSDVKGNWTNAGMISFTSKKDSYDDDITIVECFGESISLNLKSNPTKDAHIINTSINIIY